MRELPEESLKPGPPGTAPGRRAEMASVWCSHGTEWLWVKGKALYVATDALDNEIPGHETGAANPGAIPCQPTYAHPPKQHIQGET